MSTFEGSAIVYCEGALGTTNGKTTHGLVRRSRRYRILSVLDSNRAGEDALFTLDRREGGIPVVESLSQALDSARSEGRPATHFVIGLAPDGGRLPGHAREAVVEALSAGLHVVCGLHDFLGDDPQMAELARSHGATITDIRRPPDRSTLHFFTGKIDQVTSGRIAFLGTDSAVGKRTTAWMLVDAMNERGRVAELVGTGQTAWLQGARYSIVLDSLVNDFVAGEIENAVFSAWNEQRPEVIVIEGQGSLLNPAYPGGVEILAAARPHCVVLQHAPARRNYDGFPGYPIHPLPKQIQAIELISDKPVVAVTINSEHISPGDVRAACESITRETGLPAVEPFLDDIEPILKAVEPFLPTIGD